MKLKDKIKFVGYVVLVLVIIAGVSWILFIANKTRSQRICKEILYSIDAVREKEVFLEKDDIIPLLNMSKNNPKGKSAQALKIAALEHDLKQYPYIKTLHAFVLMNGNMLVKMEQKNPLIRVNNIFGQDFYIDEDGICIPVSDKYSARAVFVNGNIAEKFSANANVYEKNENGEYIYTWLRKIYELAKILQKDSFFSAFIEQIYVDAQQEIELIPKLGNQYIQLGNMDMLNDKLDRIYYFYTEGIKKSGWDKYYKINVKYKNQVICTKK